MDFRAYSVSQAQSLGGGPTCNMGRRRFLALWLAVGCAIIKSTVAGAQEATPGMKRRQDRRDDRGERLQKRDDQWVQRRDDPIGVRGPQRREDRREVRNDRRKDRRERVL